MPKLNKNQTKFFEEAINHFGEKSVDVRYKELTDFAEKKDLIVPVSALKLFCQGSVRGHYNLTLSGVSGVVVANPSNNFVYSDDDVDKDGVILSTSVFADQSSHRPLEPKLPKNFYVVLDNDLIPISRHKSINGAHRKCSDAFKNVAVSLLETAQKDIRANKCHCVVSEESPDQYYIHELPIEN
jgi:hypothetical protein